MSLWGYVSVSRLCLVPSTIARTASVDQRELKFAPPSARLSFKCLLWW